MMNKKILVSAIAAAAIGGLFVGCGSSDSSSGSTVSGIAVQGVVSDASVNIGGATDTTNAKGLFEVSNATGNTISVNFKGGFDIDKNQSAEDTTYNLVMDDAFIASNAAAGEKKYVISPVNVAASESDDDNKSGILLKNANYVLELLKLAGINVAGETAATILEKMNSTTYSGSDTIGKVVEKHYINVEAALKNDKVDELLTQVNKVYSEEINASKAYANMALVAETDLSDTDITYILNNLTVQTSALAQAIKEGNVSNAGNLEVDLTGITLDSNTTEGNFASTGIASISPMSYNASDVNVTKWGTELLFEIGNEEGTINSNASYAVKLSKLTPLTDAAHGITGFTYNANTTLSITANSNTSDIVTIDFDTEDGNITGLFGAGKAINGLDVNVTAFCSAISAVVAGSDLPDANYTGPMSVEPEKYVEMLLNVDEHRILDSTSKTVVDQDSVTIDGKGYNGYIVIDGYVAP